MGHIKKEPSFGQLDSYKQANILLYAPIYYHD